MYDMLYDIEQQVTATVMENMEEVQADELGLDRRAAYRLYVTEDCIAVNKGTDRTLQYYGGFEYVDSEYRKEMGEWVFYFADDERVAGHLERFYEDEEA